MDLLATLSDAILSPLNITLVDFLVLYREANKLAICPSPPVLNNIYHLITAVNRLTPGKAASHLLAVPVASAAAEPASAAHQFQTATSPDEEQAAGATTTTATGCCFR